MLRALLWRYRFARGFEPYLRSIDECARESAAAAQKRLALRMHAQIQYFGKRPDALPEWREAARIREPLELWRLWPELPILGKEDLRGRFNPERIQRDFGLRGERSSTGGSTGEPTPYLHDPEMVKTTAATVHYSRMAAGWRPGMPLICVWGSERDIGKARTLRGRLRWKLRGQYLLDNYRLDERIADQVFELIRRHRPVAIYGFTAMLEYLARSALATNRCPAPGDVQAAWNGGEMLYEHQRELFCSAFGVPLVNCYGGRELSAMAVETSPGSAMRILRPYVFIEIVDDRGRPVPPGTPGRVIATSLACRGTPFLRYEIGDMASYSAADRDESGIRSLQNLHGRRTDMVALPDGRQLHGMFWNHLMKEYPEIQRFQVVVRTPPAVTLRLKGDRLSASREHELRTILRRALGGLALDLEWQNHIPLTKQGKLLQVVRE